MIIKLLLMSVLGTAVLCFTSNLFAESVVLRSGVTVEGKIIEKTDDEITVQMQDGEKIPYMLSDVESIQDEKNNVARIDPPTQKHQEGTVDIPINPLMAFNGMSRDDIFNLRKLNISQVPTLAPVKYTPNIAAFGQIKDGKPWWGVLGFYYYGAGKRSIEGPSYFSQFVANPYLLVGVTTQSYAVKDSSLQAKDFTPLPSQLTWEDSGAWGQVSYNISDFYQEIQDYHYASPDIINLELINARDFGFNFFAIDSTQSSGITASVDKIIPVIQFIHSGGSCGYPGGCNNRSPTSSDLLVHVSELPARIYVKLWKNKVSDVSKKEDMDFIIDLN